MSCFRKGLLWRKSSSYFSRSKCLYIDKKNCDYHFCFKFSDYQDSDARNIIDISLLKQFTTTEKLPLETWIRTYFCIFAKVTFENKDVKNKSVFLVLLQCRYHKTIWCSRLSFQKKQEFFCFWINTDAWKLENFVELLNFEIELQQTYWQTYNLKTFVSFFSENCIFFSNFE